MKNPHNTFQTRYGTAYMDINGTDSHAFTPYFPGDGFCCHCDGARQHTIHWAV